MSDRIERECGDCGRLTKDGTEVVSRGQVIAYLCWHCWAEFLGAMAEDINGVDL